MNIRGTFILATALAASNLFAASGPPLAGEWNILPSGNAASSGDLLFRVTTGDGSDPVDVKVRVMAGASDRAVADSIRRALAEQLPRDRFRVAQGEGANVMVSDPRGRPNFSLELLASDIDNLRIAVQSVSPAASPTVPRQSMPAPQPGVTPPAPANAPGDTSAPDMRVPNPLPDVTPPPAENPPGEVRPPPASRPRIPPNDMPVPSDTPAVPDPNGIPVPSPDMPIPSPAPVPSPATPKPSKPPPQKPPV